MTATTMLRRLLAAETLFYALVARWLCGLDWPATAILFVVVAMALGGRACVIFTTYAWAHRYRSPVPPDQRVGALGFLRMALAEYVAFIALFSVVQPFERSFLGADRLAPNRPGRPPVLLVHGYQCNRGFWRWQRRRLEQAGWTVATVNLNPVFAAIDDYAARLRERIEEVCAATGADRVVLVGHSMGGLAARAYLRAHGTARIARLVTLGSPHHGSRLALLGPGANARQMEPASPWLAALNAPNAVPLPAATVAAMSPYDNYVMPQDSAVLDGARNVAIGAVGHLAMAFSPAVTQFLLAELAGASE
ncbi:MAG: alpha/beta fold hydrolase [Rhodocyclaceae bacterium]|nr:alpha/beta fold hydrolase [Rhodocyclaceae bacterium]